MKWRCLPGRGAFFIHSEFRKKFIPELRCLGWLLEADEDDDDEEDCGTDDLAGWDELLVVIGSTTRPGSCTDRCTISNANRRRNLPR